MSHSGIVRPYGYADGIGQVRAATLETRRGMTAVVMEYGARLISLRIPDHQGGTTNVVLGLSDLTSYLHDDCCFGAVVGRNANRIADARCRINGVEYRLQTNDGTHNNHSGPVGFDRMPWRIVWSDRHRVTMQVNSPHLSQGLPGNLRATATYTLGEDGSLTLTLTGVSDRDTIVNMTSHTYWNLNGEGSGAGAQHHILMIPSGVFHPVSGDMIPLPARRVAFTPFDFRHARAVGDALDPASEQIARSRGYNHTWSFRQAYLRDPLAPIDMAHLSGILSGISMRMSANAPALLMYSGGFLDGVTGKTTSYGPSAGIALEPGFVPNAVNTTDETSPVLPATARRRLTIRYDFA